MAAKSSSDFSEFLLAKNKHYLKIYKKYKTEANFTQKKKIKISPVVHEKLMRYYEEYLIFGGYPRIVLEEDYNLKKDLLKNI